MNLSEFIEKIIALRQGTSPDKDVVEYVASTIMSAGAHVQVQPFRYVTATSVFAAGAAFLLSALFLFSLSRRRRRAAFSLGLAIPLILLLELALDIHVVSWPALKKGENVVVQFPVQNAARRLVVATRYSLANGPVTPEGRLNETLSAFLLPMTLVMAVLGLCQLIMYLANFEPEDARTVTFIMGTVCMIYYALWFGKSMEGAMEPTARPNPEENAGSIAALSVVARDLANKHPRLQSTWVTIAFLGGSREEGSGAKALARMLSNKRNRGLPTAFIAIDQFGKSARYGYLIPDNDSMNPLYVDRELIRTINRAAVEVTGRHLETIAAPVSDSKIFVSCGFPAVTIAALKQEAASEDERDVSKELLVGADLVEQSMREFDTIQFP